MAFRRKAQFVLQLKPDILIVPECENPEKLIFPKNIPVPNDLLWFGSNPNKGLGIFSFGNYKFKKLDCHNDDLRLIVPLEVSNGENKFNLIAIWANNTNDKKNQYVGQIWKALSHYDDLLNQQSSILIGDFNSNSIWDQPRRIGNHTHVVEKLIEKDIYSCYHNHFGFEHGKEKHSTLYMYRDNKKGYHIDYCFASKDFIDKLISVKIGNYKKWGKYSDHMPVIAHFNAFTL